MTLARRLVNAIVPVEVLHADGSCPRYLIAERVSAFLVLGEAMFLNARPNPVRA